MRYLLRTYDLDSVGYDVNGYQIKPIANTTSTKGYVNLERSKMVFNNIDISHIDTLSSYITIKLIGVEAINENGQNVIDYNSPPHLRTSNIVLSGMDFTNGVSTNIVGQFTNFNPNEELVFQSVFFHRGDLSDFTHYYQHVSTSVLGPQTPDFFRFLTDYETIASNSLTRFRITSSTITQLNNKIMRASRPRLTSDSLFIIDVADAGDGTLPARVNGQVNNLVTITVLPENNQWFHRRLTFDIEEDLEDIELTAYNPQTSTINLTFELRDLITNQLQPVVSNSGKVYPSLNFIIEIF